MYTFIIHHVRDSNQTPTKPPYRLIINEFVVIIKKLFQYIYKIGTEPLVFEIDSHLTYYFI